MTKEYLTGIVTGALATTFGFVLTMLWDIWKLHKDDKRRMGSVIRAIEHELEDNVGIADSNKRLLEAELPVLKENKHLIGVTVPLKHGIWEILKVNLPDKLLEKDSLLSILSELAIVASHINEGMASRQIYRDTSANNTAFSQNMDGRNRMLIEQLEKFTKGVEEALSELKNLA